MKSNKPLPNFIIVGAAKCGTTALASILSNHPDCCMSLPKETCFFLRPDFEEKYENHLKWYQSCFSHYNGESKVGEATPSYASRGKDDIVAQRIHAFNENLKIIYLVRDPMERQISAWKMYYASGRSGYERHLEEPQWALKGFEYWMRKKKETDQWAYNRYGYQLEAFKQRFPDHRICVSFLEDWKPDKTAEVSRIMQFLDLDPTGWEKAAPIDYNSGAKRRIERPVLKKFRTSALGRGLISLIPQKARLAGRNALCTKPFVTPQPDLPDSLKIEFAEYLADDLMQFLKEQGKPTDYWKSLKMVNDGTPSGR